MKKQRVVLKPDGRRCLYCMVPLIPHVDEKRGQYRKRRTCSVSHARRYQSVGRARPGDPFLASERREPLFLPAPIPVLATRTRAEITACPASRGDNRICGSTMLWDDGPFVACFLGHRTPAKDGDWLRV